MCHAVAKPSTERVVFIIERLSGRAGGAERVLIDTAGMMAAAGFEVDVVSYERETGPPFYPVPADVRVINLRRCDPERSLWRQAVDAVRRLVQGVPLFVFPFDRLLWLSRHGGFECALRRWIANEAPDVAVAFLPPAIVALARGAAGAKLRLVASVHNVPSLDLASPVRWDPNPVDVKRRLAALERYDAITVPVEDFRHWFDDALRSRVFVVPNPVHPASIGVDGDGQADYLVALAVGRLVEVKRFDLLLKAWAQSARSCPGWILRIVGDGPLRPRLEAQICELGLEDSVHLCGRIQDIGSLYRAASLLVHPAAYEGWGLAVSEALAHGVPVIAFADCPGVNCLVEDNVNGLLVEPGCARVTALATSLERMMHDHALRARLGGQARASVAAFAPACVSAIWRKVLFPNISAQAEPEDSIHRHSGVPEAS